LLYCAGLGEFGLSFIFTTAAAKESGEQQTGNQGDEEKSML
jgi:hypothetical protein